MDDVKEKLSKIFPNSEIIIKIEKSHDYRLNGKYAGVYIDGARMSTQRISDFSWDVTWIDIMSTFDYFKTCIDCPELYAVAPTLPKKRSASWCSDILEKLVKFWQTHKKWN